MLVTKTHNKTPYELFLGRKPALSFMRPFGCPVTIVNTLDHLGKFYGKSDVGFFIGYSINSKAFRVFNTRTRFVEENLHKNFLENKPNVAGTGPNWMFDIDTLTMINTLTMSMNYQPVFAENQTNGNAGTKANIDARQAGKKTDPGPQYVLLPLSTSNFQGPKSLEDEVADDSKKKSTKVPRKKNGVQNTAKEGDKINQINDVRDQEEALRKQFEQEFQRLFGQGEAANTNSTNILNIVSSSVNAVSFSFTTVDPGRERAQRNELETVTLPNDDLPTDPLMPDLEDTTNLHDTRIFSGAYDDEVKGTVADFNNLELTTFMDVNSAFLYGTIKEDVYVCQPSGFKDSQFPDKVYKVENALYGLHQAPRAWYETLSTYLLENRFRKGIIDKTLFIKKDKGDILLVKVYVNDIIFGSTKKSLCIEFEGLMHKKFHMSFMGELTFFLGL
nr:putative ribonuclease H-like domain-containing protein [Tanacetum cinerariifolium]